MHFDGAFVKTLHLVPFSLCGGGGEFVVGADVAVFELGEREVAEQLFFEMVCWEGWDAG